MSGLIVSKIADLKRVEYQGEAVVTLSMMDAIHERPSGTAGRNFRQHRDKMLEGRHFFEICGDEIRRCNLEADSMTRSVILLTQRGYLLLVKSFKDDLAWQVQDALVEHYFRSTGELPSNHLMRLGHEIAIGVREGLRLGLEPIHQKIESVRTEMKSGFDAVNTRIDAIEKRRDLTPATKRFHVDTVAAFFNNRCPCCQVSKVLDAGQNRINAHYDHWFSKGRNRPHETWLVCDECNQKLLNHEFRDRHQKAFDYYQMRREQKHTPLLDFHVSGE